MRALVSGGVLAWLFARTDWERIRETFSNLQFSFCLAALAIYCSSQVVSGCRWMLLARSLGFHEKLGRLVALNYVGMFFNLFLPTSLGGDVVRAWYLRRKAGEGWAAALCVFSERFCGLLSLLVVACTAVALSFGSFPRWVVIFVFATTAGAVMCLVALPLASRFSEKCRLLVKGLSLERGQRGRWLAALAISLVVQVIAITALWLLVKALHLPVSFLQFSVVAPVVILLTMVPISMNGLGVREGSLVLLLAPAGVGSAEALALGFLWFCMLAAAGSIGGLVYMVGGFSAENEMIRGTIHGPVSRDPDQGRAGQPKAAA